MVTDLAAAKSFRALKHRLNEARLPLRDLLPLQPQPGMRLSRWLFWYSVTQQFTIRCFTRVESFRRHPKDFEWMLFGFFSGAFPLITLCSHIGLSKCSQSCGHWPKCEARSRCFRETHADRTRSPKSSRFILRVFVRCVCEDFYHRLITDWPKCYEPTTIHPEKGWRKRTNPKRRKVKSRSHDAVIF